MKKACVLSFVSILFTLSKSEECQSKELLGLRIGASAWDANLQGDLQTDDLMQDDQTILATRFSPFDMNVEDEVHSAFSVEIRHSIPLVPKLLYRSSQIRTQSETTTTREINFVDNTFAVDTNLAVEFDLSHTDISFYYPVMDSWIKLDLGATMREFDGSVEITEQASADDGTEGEGTEGEPTTTMTGVAKIDDSPTLLFSRATIQLPESNIYFGYHFQYWNSGDEHFSDTESSVSYHLESQRLTYFFEIGYKKSKFMSDSFGEIQSRLTQAGPFVRIIVGL